MGKVTVMGTLTCQDGTAEQVEPVLRAMVAAARDEPGVEVYSYHRGEGDEFWFFALMSDQGTLQDHGSSAAMQAAMADLGPLLAAPPRMTVCSPVAAVGLTL